MACLLRPIRLRVQASFEVCVKPNEVLCRNCGKPPDGWHRCCVCNTILVYNCACGERFGDIDDLVMKDNEWIDVDGKKIYRPGGTYCASSLKCALRQAGHAQ